jgi:hypothetical protein
MREKDAGGREDAESLGARVEKRPQVLFYPNALKHHYIDLLRRWKEERARVTGKPVGWQTIRDMIMEPEDAKLLAAEQLIRRERNAKEARRIQAERDSFLTADHLKAWDRGAALPSDPRCYFIERFLNRLRKDGIMGTVEQAATEARHKYIKEAMFALYRVDRRVREGGRADLLAEVLGFQELSGMGFLIEGSAVDHKQNRIELVMRIGEVDKLIYDLEIFLVRQSSGAGADSRMRALTPKDVNREQMRLLYHGSLIPFEYPRKDVSEGQGAGGMYLSRWAILATNSFDITAADVGLEGNLPSFLTSGVHILVGPKEMSITFMAGGQLEWLSGIVAMRPESQAKSAILYARRAAPVSKDVAAALSRRNFARPFFV